MLRAKVRNDDEQDDDEQDDDEQDDDEQDDDEQDDDEQDDDDSLSYASDTKRFVNFVLDQILSICFAKLVLHMLGAEQAAWIADKVDLVFWSLGFQLLYYFIFEAMFARTPAKLLTRTLVVTEDGDPPSSGQVFIRSVVRFLPFDALTFLTGACRGMHDRWSKTCVVDVARP